MSESPYERMSAESYQEQFHAIHRELMSYTFVGSGKDRDFVTTLYRLFTVLQTLHERIATLEQRFTALASDVEMLAGDDFGDGLPF